MPTVYIETSIPSYFHTVRTGAKARSWKAATRTWWRHCRPSFDCVTSQVTFDELAQAPAARGSRMAALLRPLPLLPFSDRVGDVARFFAGERLVPRENLADALHLAFCAVHGVDYLLTWNCQHLANPNKATHLAVLCGRKALHSPTIVTPFQLPPE
ncbi:MAG: hypothetical protein ACKVZJ_12715 [Phycisphaerales bacterium]